ncbi:MAG: hypothetical protein ACPG06_02780, partial [Alphaproteobacteria bacterium]
MMDGLEQLFDRLMEWLNANEGVVEGVAVLIAVATLAFPQLRAALFGNNRDNTNNQGFDVSALDPALIDTMLSGAAKGGAAGSFFAPRLPAFGRLDQTWSSGPVEDHKDAHGSPTIAVFPFSPLDDGEARSGLCHALADEIATGFAGMTGYEVLAGRAVHGMEHQIAHAGTRYVVEGSVRTLGENVRIIAR